MAFRGGSTHAPRGGVQRGWQQCRPVRPGSAGVLLSLKPPLPRACRPWGAAAPSPHASVAFSPGARHAPSLGHAAIIGP